MFSTLPRSGRIACVVAVAALLGGAAGGVALDDEELGVLSIRSRAVAELAGQREPAARRAARVTCAEAARDASRARAARMMRATICSATVRLELSHCSSAGRTAPSTSDCTSGLFSRSLVCPGTAARDEDAEHAEDALADVFGGERDAARREVVRLDVVADRLARARAQAVLVRAAGARGDAVDVALELLVGASVQRSTSRCALRPPCRARTAARGRRARPRSRRASRRYATMPSAWEKTCFCPLVSSMKMTFSPCGGSSRPRAARGWSRR